MRNSRQERAQEIIARLKNLGIHIEWQRVQGIAGSGSIGRPHIAQAMLERKYVISVKEAFNKYLARGRPAYVEWKKKTPVEVVEIILRANGLPVLAHPLTVDDLGAIIIELKTAGLIGIEAYYNGYTAAEVRGLISLADKYNLITTGGSDYHGLDPSTETTIGGVDVPLEAVERLIALAEQRAIVSQPPPSEFVH
jgi:predicted metal-dependent phosphoesterase TrpH